MQILFVFFIVLNLIIYHKIFRVIYFDFQKAFFQEFLGSILVAVIETSIVMVVGPYLLLGIAVIFGIVTIVKFVNKKNKSSMSTKNPETTDSSNTVYAKKENCPADNIQKNDPHINEDISPINGAENINSQTPKTSSDETCTTMFCSHCGKKIKRSAKFCNFCGKPNLYGKQESNL